MSTSFAILEEGRTHNIDTTIDGSILRAAEAPLLDALGWTRKPEGLCQGDVCIPIGHRPELVTEQRVDLEGLAEVLGCPLAIDRDEAVASFGSAAGAHGAQLAEGLAPDFTLPDLSGKEYSLSAFKGKKVLLIAYASW